MHVLWSLNCLDTPKQSLAWDNGYIHLDSCGLILLISSKLSLTQKGKSAINEKHSSTQQRQ